MERERPLDADPERLLAHRERLPGAGALALDHDPFEDLDAPALTLDHLKVDAHGVAWLEPGAIAAQLALFEVLDDPIHKNGPQRGRGTMLATPLRHRLVAQTPITAELGLAAAGKAARPLGCIASDTSHGRLRRRGSRNKPTSPSPSDT